jgi:hypothetical protein
MAGDLLVEYPLTPTLSPKGAREKKEGAGLREVDLLGAHSTGSPPPADHSWTRARWP